MSDSTLGICAGLHSGNLVVSWSILLEFDV